MKLSQMFKSLWEMTEPRLPEILAGVSISLGLVGTVYACKATVKAVKTVDEEKKEKEYTDLDGELVQPELTKMEIVKCTWKHYIPSALVIAGSVSCGIASQALNSKRKAALVTAATFSSAALKDYKESVKEIVGAKKRAEVDEKVAEKQVARSNQNKSNVYRDFDEKKKLFYEPLSDRYFWSDVESVRKALNDLNAAFMYEAFISVNDWYDMLDIPRTKVGDYLGWNGSDGLIDIVPNGETKIAPNGDPCFVIVYCTEPEYDYKRYH